MLESSHAPGRLTSRAALIRSGLELLTQNGFGSTGLDEILKRAKVPKGSFYHHFSSKNEFALVLIAEYNNYFRRRLERLLAADGQAGASAIDQIRGLVDGLGRTMAKHHFRRGCLIGNFSQELGVHFEDFRRRLEAVFLEWEAILAACLERGKQDGSVSVEIDTKQAAAFFWTGWEGAVMRAKIAVATQPMEDFGATFIKWIQADQGRSGALRAAD